LTPDEDPLELLRGAFYEAVAAAHPGAHLQEHLPKPPAGRLVVVGAGKAAAAMAQTVEARYPLDKLEGLVITRYGHKLPTERVRVLEASHPVPDQAGYLATRQLLELLQNLSEEDTVLCLVSGGGSALLTVPRGVSLEQKAALTGDLLRSGATIHEINAVRKHLSAVKGGLLAKAAAPARVYGFYLSDVVGDDLASIASGPTSPDLSTYEDALAVLERYRIEAPEARLHLQNGVAGGVPETPKPDDPVFAKVSNTVIASNQKSLEAVAEFFRERGIPAHILSSSVEGEASEAAKMHAAIARQVRVHAQPFARPCALISGGETTVTVGRKDAKGGRNSEFALALALALGDLTGVYALAADTDGIDGSEDNAGVFVTPDSLEGLGRARARRLLEANSSYEFFRERDALLVTGTTHTNVNDLRIVLLL
jgi:hydroxypyruvate reductase